MTSLVNNKDNMV